MKNFFASLLIIIAAQTALAGVDIISSVTFHDRDPDSWETSFRKLNQDAIIRCAGRLNLPEDRVYVYQTSETYITGRFTKTMWAHFDCNARGSSFNN